MSDGPVGDRIDSFEPATALAVYGTLAPGESNHHVLADIDGSWIDGRVRGHRYHGTWRGLTGYPALRLDENGPDVPVRVLVSDELERRWEQLDWFEGPGYRRRAVEVLAPDGGPRLGIASVYEARVDIDRP